MGKRIKRSQEKRVTRRAQIIRHMRLSKQISQKEAARLCMCSEQAIGHYENGRMDVSEERLVKMLRAYGYSRAQFNEYLDGKEIPLDLKNECFAILNQLDSARISLVYGLLTNFVGPKTGVR